MKKFNNLVNSSMIYLFPITALILSIYAKETSAAARNALYLCIDVVVPSLFPFFVLSRLAVPYLSRFSCPEFLKYFAERFFRLPYYTLITIVLGYLSGYPTGAKLARDMFDEGILDSHQASKIITVANNCSPLFLIGTIGAGLFKSIKIGFLLLVVHWLAGIAAAFFTGRIADHLDKEKYSPAQKISKKDSKTAGFFFLFPTAIEEAALLSIKVTGYIVLFAVLSELLAKLGFFALLGEIAGLLYIGDADKTSFSQFISAIFRGIMEITSGSQSISQASSMAIDVQLAAVSLICGFAGFSVHTQVMGIMKGSKAKYRIFFAGKLLHGTFACLMTLAITSLVPFTIQTSTMIPEIPLDFSSIRVITVAILIVSLLIVPSRIGQKTYPKSR